MQTRWNLSASWRKKFAATVCFPEWPICGLCLWLLFCIGGASSWCKVSDWQWVENHCSSQGLWLAASHLFWVLQHPVQAVTARKDTTIYFGKIQKLTFCRVSRGQKGATFFVHSLFRHQMCGGIPSHRCSSAKWYGARCHDRQISHTKRKRTKAPMDFLIPHTWEEPWRQKAWFL